MTSAVSPGRVALLCAWSAVAACGTSVSTDTARLHPGPARPATPAPVEASHGRAHTARLVLSGDLEFGPGLEHVVRSDPSEVLAGVRHVVAGADVAAADLDAPEIAPDAARAAATAGFDVLTFGATDDRRTRAAIERAGITALGRVPDEGATDRPHYMDARGIQVAIVAVDPTDGSTASEAAGPFALQDADRTRDVVAAARDAADLVVVRLHLGPEDGPGFEARTAGIAATLASWGVDVVWGHGPSTPQPVTVLERGGAPTLLVTGLGDLVHERSGDTSTGELLEMLADEHGVVAFRLGATDDIDGRVRLRHWQLPAGDAALLDGGWWTPTRPVDPIEPQPVRTPSTVHGTVIDAAAGDVDGDGDVETVVSSRREYRPTLISAQFPERTWADTHGRAAHLGVYDLDGSLQWGAGTMFRPVARLAACDGSLALAFDELDDPAIVATTAWRWQGFGFTIPAELPGPGAPACADVDGDGRLDPYLVRSTP